MPFYVRNNTNWTQATRLAIYNNGAWANATSAYIRSGSNWVRFFHYGIVNITNQSLSASDVQIGVYASATSGYRLQSDGSVYARDTPGGDYLIEGWVSPSGAAGGEYQARATIVSNTAILNGTYNTWLTLSTNREWSVQAIADGAGLDVTNTAQITVEIRDANSTIVLDSATINLSATASTGF